MQITAGKKQELQHTESHGTKRTTQNWKRLPQNNHEHIKTKKMQVNAGAVLQMNLFTVHKILIEFELT
jgi:hypothetical protein